MSEESTYKFRPASRLLLAIGRELVHDKHAAIMELVKNAYDADSEDVKIIFNSISKEGGFTITISDQGHGMTKEDIVNKWMVPSTRSKIDNKQSPKGRRFQGKKGIGRYASAVLGDDLLLESVTEDGNKTTIMIQWDLFKNNNFLDEIEIPIQEEKTTEKHGTNIIITNQNSFKDEWETKNKDIGEENKVSDLDSLYSELRKFRFPFDIDTSEDFKMKLIVSKTEDSDEINENIEPYPITEIYDYRIKGVVQSNGKGTLEYSQQTTKNHKNENILFDFGKETECGALEFDLRVYDTDAAAITRLIDKAGTKKIFGIAGETLQRNEMRGMLNIFNGIGVYRDRFRIRPMGDADFDWLKLNMRKTLSPSIRLKSNQVIGYIQIQSEQASGLIEKSGRDGLLENLAFTNFKEITKQVITKLESRRASYRKKINTSTDNQKIQKQLENIFSYKKLNFKIKESLQLAKVNKKISDDVTKIINQDEEARHKSMNQLQRAIAIYQSQATVGKIFNVILHEGRRPLSVIKNSANLMHKYYKKYIKENNNEYLDKILHSTLGITEKIDFFVALFRKIEPLATGNRLPAQSLILRKEIEKCFRVFNHEFKKRNIEFKIIGSNEIIINAWQQDIYLIFANLIDNSIYWINSINNINGEINIKMLHDYDDEIYIQYTDNGPGIEHHLIESSIIFDPYFSTKAEDSAIGLGLAIAGEAAQRNGFKLEARESLLGAYFVLRRKTNG